MKKRLLALLLALLAALSCLTGCMSKSASACYETIDEMLSYEDVMVDLSVPYHGANLLVSGFVCRSSQTANLIFTLQDTGDSDGVWTELRVSGSQIWLNVAQVAERTLAFDLPDLRRGDIEDLQKDQTAPWLSYTWQGDLWAGLPDWAELLDKVWDKCKSDLNSHISQDGDSYRLELSGNSLTKAQRNLLQDLVKRTEDFRTVFCTWTQEESQLIGATMMEASEFFDESWQTWSDRLAALESGEDAPEQLTMTLTENEYSYDLTWSVDQAESGVLTVTPIAPKSTEAPTEVMEFGAYDEEAYYLLTFSESYIADTLEGVELDPELEEIFQNGEGSEPVRQPMETGTLVDYADLATIQFVPEGGEARTVPILASYLGNSLTSLDDQGGQITDLTLEGQGWYQYVYAQAADGRKSSQVLEESIRSYYDAYINLSGYLLVQDLTEQATSDQGAMAQAFSYRPDNYSDPVAQVIVLLPRSGNESFTVLDLELHLSEMSQADKDAVAHLLAYLGLDLGLDLDA